MSDLHPPNLGLRVGGDADGPLYRQIAEQLRRRIRSGAFPDGYRLPPSRALAQQLGTHRHTVTRAYRELAASGLLKSTVGRGSFVSAPRSEPTPRPPAGDAPLPWEALVSEAAHSDPLRSFTRHRRERGSRGAFDLARMEPPPDLLPVEELRRATDHVLRTRGARALGYAPKAGIVTLREQIATDLGRRGVPAHPDDVLVTNGSQQGLDLITRVLVSPGDLILTHATTYYGALHVFAANGARVQGVPSDDEGPDLDALRRLGRQGPKFLYLMPNHCNPTGSKISERRRRAVLEWARDAQVAVVEDDYAADLELDEDATNPPALRALDGEVIHIGSFSKRLIPALRIGYVVTPKGLAPHMLAFKHTADLCTSSLTQLALAEFLDRGYLLAHLARTRPAYRRRRDALCDGLRAHLPRDVRWVRPDRGPSVWLDLPGLDPARATEQARARGVWVGSGHHYQVREGHRPGLRLNFIYEPPERLTDAAARVAAAIREVRGGSGSLEAPPDLL